MALQETEKIIAVADASFLIGLCLISQWTLLEAMVERVYMMKLSKKEARYLKDVDLIEATRKARQDATRLLNDQGLAVLSLVLSDFIAEMMDHPEKLTEAAQRGVA